MAELSLVFVTDPDPNMNAQVALLPIEQSTSQAERNGSKTDVSSYLRLSLDPSIQVLLPADCLSEITFLTLSQIVPIPDVAAQVIGVCEWRGEVIWLIDLAAHLGCQPLYELSRRQSEQSALVINHQGINLGLVVHQAHQIQSYTQSRLLPVKSTQDELVPITGYLAVGKQPPLPILDCEVIVNSFRQ